MTTEQRHTVTLEDFKLIKTFYPAFQRAQGVMSNDIIIDWNRLMPVVEKIWDLDINTIDLGANFTQSNPKTNIFRLPLMVPIDMAYEAVVEFIKYWNSQAEYKR